MTTHRLNIFPLGNADCCRIDLDNGDQILIDFAAMCDPKCEGDLRIDLPSELRRDLDSRKRDFYNVVAFTHLDDDHIRGASDFFYFEHAKKYQEKVNGKSRIKVRELWVPAAVITEEGCTDEDRIIRQEARYRLKNGSGTSGMTPHFHSLVEIGQAEQHSAAIASRADNQHAERLPSAAQ